MKRLFPIILISTALLKAAAGDITFGTEMTQGDVGLLLAPVPRLTFSGVPWTPNTPPTIIGSVRTVDPATTGFLVGVRYRNDSGATETITQTITRSRISAYSNFLLVLSPDSILTITVQETKTPTTFGGDGR